MNNKIQLGFYEVAAFSITVVCTKLFIYLPNLMSLTAGSAGWMLPIYAGILALIPFSIIIALYKGFESMDLLDLSDYTFGKWGKAIIGIIFILLLLFLLALLLRGYISNTKLTVMPMSSTFFVALIFLSSMIVGAYFGLEAIIYINAISLPIIGVLFLISIFTAGWHIDTSYIYPLLGNGPGPLFLGGMYYISIFFELLLMLFLIPYFKKGLSVKKTAYSSYFLTVLVFTVFIIFVFLSIPYPIIKGYFMPFYQVARTASIGFYFQRFESVFILGWAMLGTVYLSLLLYFLTHIFAKTFELPFQRTLALPFALIAICLALEIKNAEQLQTLYGMMQFVLWIFVFIIPIFLLISAKIAKRRRENKCE